MRIGYYSNGLPLIVVTFFMLTLLGGCVTAKQKALDSGLKPVTNAELKMLFAEKNTANWVNTEKGRTAVVTYLPDGSLSADSGGETYIGTYSFKNDEYCSKMDHRNGEVRCTTWFKVEDKTYHLFKTNGSMAGKLTFQ